MIRLVLLAGWLMSFAAWAQNLVPNPSFEELIRCPHSFSTDRKDFIVPGWISATRGTPDHFHGCSWGEADVPYNWAGSSNAKTGKGYVGIYVWMSRSDGSNYREYIQCELAEPLLSGARYRVEFYYKLASYAVYAANRIGLHLSVEQLSYDHDQLIDVVPLLSIKADSAITLATGSWEHAVMEFKAAGGERFVTIGNFYSNEQTQSTRLPHRIGKSNMLVNSAYYYIDDVSVEPLDSLPRNTLSRTEFSSEHVELDRDYILKNIQFEFDSYRLMKSSYKELDLVVELLKSNPTFKVRLSGHTDFIGSDEYNLTLSRNRARSVADYFISKGIKPDRIQSFGFGKTRPIMLEKTDQARMINRRVEVRFTAQEPADKF